MSISLAEQLAEIFGKPVPAAKVRKKTVEPQLRACHKNSKKSGISRHEINDTTNRELHEIISSLSTQGFRREILESLTKRAIQAGRDSVSYRIRGGEEAMLEKFFKLIAEFSTEEANQELNKLTAMAVFASNPGFIAKLQNYMMESVFRGDIKLDPASPDSVGNTSFSFILERAGGENFITRLKMEQHRAATRAAAERLAREQKSVRDQLGVIKTSICSKEWQASFSSHVTDTDLLLVRTWAGCVGVPDHERQESLLESTERLAKDLGDKDFTRLVSARLAEHSAMEFYRMSGFRIEDTSILQIKMHDSRWKTHDLEASGMPIDVKNARRSFSSPNNYVDHCFKPKHDQHTGREVKIVGVLSDYLKKEDLLEGKQQSSLILGEVKNSDIVRLQNWMNTTFGEILEVDLTLDNRKFIPGWMFEYAPDKYPESSCQPFQIESLIKDWLESGLPLDEIPKPLLIISGKLYPLEYVHSSTVDAIILNLLKQVSNGPGVSRRTLYGLVIGLTLQQAKLETDYVPAQILPWLFFDHSGMEPTDWPREGYDSLVTDWPLGHYDPLGYVAGIVIALDKLWKKSRDILKKYSRFRLSGNGILKGYDQGLKRYITVLAYCGGWRIRPVRAKCGKNPIFLGESESCPVCYLLICPDCGFCSNKCPSNSARQAAWVLKDREQTAHLSVWDNRKIY